MTKHLFIVTSAVSTNFGAFTLEQRIEQLFNTINSIDDKAPNSLKAVFESSGKPLDDDTSKIIGDKVDYLIDMSKDPHLQSIHNGTTNWDVVKNLCEITAFYNGLQMMKDNNAFEGIDRVHKLSGRYTLSKYFNMNLYDMYPDKIIVCKKNPSQFGPNVNVPWQHCSRLWSWPTMYHDIIVNFYKQAIDEFNKRASVGGYIDIEHMLYLFLPKELIQEVDTIGVWGSLGQNGRFVSN